MQGQPLCQSTRSKAREREIEVTLNFVQDLVVPAPPAVAPMPPTMQLDPMPPRPRRARNTGGRVGRPRLIRTVRGRHRGLHGGRKGRPAYRGTCGICLDDVERPLHRLACGSNVVPHAVCNTHWVLLKVNNSNCPICMQPVMYETDRRPKHVVVDLTAEDADI